MEAIEAIGRKLELGIYRTSKPIKDEEKAEKDEKKAKKKQKSASPTKSVARRSESSSPVKSPEPHTQRLLVKMKEKQCIAEAKIEKRTVAREAAHKTVSLPSSSRFEKVSLSVKASLPAAAVLLKRPKEIKEQEETPAEKTCAHLVEQKLTEIAKQAEELARTIRRAAEIEEDGEVSETIETATQGDVDSLVLDFGEDEPIRVEVAAPVVKASESLSLPSPKSPKSSSSTASTAKFGKTARTVQATGELIRKPHHTSELKRLAEATRSLLEIAEDQPLTEVSDSEMQRRIPAAMSTSDIRSERQSLADRLSKGLQELTHGSSDRLQKWKTKLNSSGRLRKQEQSAPPPASRGDGAGQWPVATATEMYEYLDFATPMLAAAAPTNDVIFDWAPDRSPRPLHASKSAQNAHQLLGKDMEHRTLRSKENSHSQKDLSFHYQHMNSLQKMMSTFDGYTKSPLYDLPPPAKITPLSGVKPTHEDILRPIAFRPPLANKPELASHRQSHDVIRLDRAVIRGDLAKSASNLSHMPIVSAKPRTMFQPSTSYSPDKPIENEYDTVPDYIEKEKFMDFGSSGSDYGSFVGNKLSSSTASSGSSHLSSPPSTNKKSYPSMASTGRSSSGVHVTPSPSDSGIMDIETVIRDKENELREVRTTMEHNEEVIVKVYQEKERAWKEELDGLRTRLAASERGENALRAQLAGCQRQTETLTRNADSMREEKSGLLRKCFQLERELTQLKAEINKPCQECQRRQPVPAPRHIKEADATIRTEVSSLRDEVATLKDALNGQIHLFNEERKKWEGSGNSRQDQVPSGRDRLI